MARTSHDNFGRAEPQFRVRFFVVTVSTGKYARKLRGVEVHDDSGDVAVRLIQEARGWVDSRHLIPDDSRKLKERARAFLEGPCDVGLFLGGSGISPDDVTVDSVRPFFEKELPGFGEFFRRASYEEVGTAAMLSRATAGVSRGKLIFCLPGSPYAVET
jgi:molybdopterin adenylyltransferase